MTDKYGMDQVREALTRAMTKAGTVPTTLSLKVGTNSSLVKSIMEKNKDVGIVTLARLADAMNISVLELLGGDNISRDRTPSAELLALLFRHAIDAYKAGLDPDAGDLILGIAARGVLRRVAAGQADEDNHEMIASIWETARESAAAAARQKAPPASP